MGKILSVLTIVSLLILLIGCLIMPSYPIFWLASSTQFFIIIRFALIALLATFLYMGNPTNLSVRIILGIIATVLGVWAMNNTLNGYMPLLDGYSLTAASFVLGLIAVEAEPEGKENHWFGVYTLARPYFLKIERNMAVVIVIGLLTMGLFSQGYQEFLLLKAHL